MTESKAKEEIWTYIGRRILNGKLVCAYMDERAEEKYFSAKSYLNRSIGQRYTVKIEGDTLRGQPEYLDERHQIEENISKWQLADRAAYAQDGMRKKEASFKGEDYIGNLTLDDVRKAYNKTPSQRSALLGVVLAHIQRK
jgi:hypothetical protein